MFNPNINSSKSLSKKPTYYRQNQNINSQQSIPLIHSRQAKNSDHSQISQNTPKSPYYQHGKQKKNENYQISPSHQKVIPIQSQHQQSSISFDYKNVQSPEQLKKIIEKQKRMLLNLRVERDSLKKTEQYYDKISNVKISMNHLIQKGKVQSDLIDCQRSLKQDSSRKQQFINDISQYQLQIERRSDYITNKNDQKYWDMNQQMDLRVQNLQQQVNWMNKKLQQQRFKHQQDQKRLQDKINRLRINIKQKQRHLKQINERVCGLYVHNHVTQEYYQDTKQGQKNRAYNQQRHAVKIFRNTNFNNYEQKYIGQPKIKQFVKDIFDRVEQKQEIIIFRCQYSSRSINGFQCIYNTKQGEYHAPSQLYSKGNLYTNNNANQNVKLNFGQIQLKDIISIRAFYKHKIVGMVFQVRGGHLYGTKKRYISFGDCAQFYDNQVVNLARKKLVTIGSHWSKNNMIGITICTKDNQQINQSKGRQKIMLDKAKSAQNFRQKSTNKFPNSKQAQKKLKEKSQTSKFNNQNSKDTHTNPNEQLSKLVRKSSQQFQNPQKRSSLQQESLKNSRKINSNVNKSSVQKSIIKKQSQKRIVISSNISQNALKKSQKQAEALVDKSINDSLQKKNIQKKLPTQIQQKYLGEPTTNYDSSTTDKMMKPQHQNSMSTVEEQLRKMRAKLQQQNPMKRLKEVDFFVLDNSIRESTVGVVRGHTINDKMKIIDHVLNCGYKDLIVAAFQHKKRVDDQFVKHLTIQNKDKIQGINIYGFTQLINSITPQGRMIADVTPTALLKMSILSVPNPIFEIDLADKRINWDIFTIKDLCQLTLNWFDWTIQNLQDNKKIALNLRDFPLAMNDHKIAPKVLEYVSFLSSLPSKYNFLGILIQDATGKFLPQQIGAWVSAVRNIMTANKFYGKLLVHIHEKWGFAGHTQFQCIINGADGVWASVCQQGAALGHASSTMTLMNLVRFGNQKVIKKYRCDFLRKAGRQVTLITTGSPPHPKQPICGDRALDLVFDFAGIAGGLSSDEFDLSKFFRQERTIRITTLASEQRILEKLQATFGKKFDLKIAQNVKKQMIKDLINNVKQDYNSPIGLAMLYARTGQKDIDQDMAQIINKLQQQQNNGKKFPLIQQVKQQIWDKWNTIQNIHNQQDSLEYDTFYHAFLEQFFGCFRCEYTYKALKAIDMNKDGNIDWKQFRVYLLWALRQYPDQIDSIQKLIEIAIKRGVIPDMQDVIVDNINSLTDRGIQYKELGTMVEKGFEKL